MTMTASLLEKPIVKQFTKFLLVGGISFAIDYTIRKLLTDWIHIGDESIGQKYGKQILEIFPQLVSKDVSPRAAFFPVACFVAGIVATFNSFAMNRKFTFKLQTKDDKVKQLLKVYLVTIVGSSINIGVSAIVYHYLPQLHVLGATACGAGLAAFWNFAGQRYFAFQAHKQ
jgi:putative flippase GtrA